MYIKHSESHRLGRISWLRAAVLGANDGIISIASLLMGVTAAGVGHHALMLTGVSALVAGAMSMAAGEYISVSSQADTEQAEIQREKAELKSNRAGEEQELTRIYQSYGLELSLAAEVSKQLMKQNALAAHMREELGITNALRARPLQAALFSALSFSIGASLPLLVSFFLNANFEKFIFTTAVSSLICLGAVAAKLGGSSWLKGALRVSLWGTLAMLITYFMGSLFGLTSTVF